MFFKVVAERDTKIAELNRGLLLQKKLHNRALKDKQEKHEKDLEKVKMLEEVQQNLISRIKDLEKALELTNVYSRRKQNKDAKEMALFSTQGPLAPILKKFQEESQQLIQKLEANNPSGKPSSSGIKQLNTSLAEREDVAVDAEIADEPQCVAEHNCNTGENRDFDDSNKLSSTPTKIATALNMQTESRIEKNTTVDNEDDLQRTLDDVSKKTSQLQLQAKPVDKETPGGPLKNDVGANLPSNNNNNNISLPTKPTTVNGCLKDTTSAVKEPRNETTPETFEIIESKPLELVPQRRQMGVQESEATQAKKLLLAKLQAIDSGENPVEVTESSLAKEEKNTPSKKVNKKPIFLESSPKVATTTAAHVSSPSKTLTSISKKIEDGDIDFVLASRNQGEQKPSFLNNSASTQQQQTTQQKPKPSFLQNAPIKQQQQQPQQQQLQRERKDSWEFKRTDENLHKGLHAHANLPPNNNNNNNSTNNTNSQPSSGETSRKTSNALSSTSFATDDSDSGYTPTVGKLTETTRPRRGSFNDGARPRGSKVNGEEGLNTGYFPTMIDSNSTGGSNKKAVKRGDDLFNQFEDPFKSTNPSSDSPGSLLLRGKDGPREFLPKSMKNSITAASDHDDLEEMFIL